MPSIQDIVRFALLFFALPLSASCQESVILSDQLIDWSDYQGLYIDEDKNELSDKWDFLSKVEMHELMYRSDDLAIQAFMAVPKGDGPFPVIIYNRGGNRDFGALQLFKGKWKMPVAYFFSKLAANGYIVIGCNYRGSGKSEGMEEFGGADVRDVLHMMDVIDEIPKSDTSRIGMYGWSRGGMMTYLALQNTTRIKAAAVGGGKADLTTIYREEMEKQVYAELIPDYYENKEAELKKRSAVYNVDKFSKTTPLLIMHGNADWRVRCEESLKLAKELDKQRIPFRLKIFEGGDHGLSEFTEEVDRDVLSWFDKYLKGAEALPDMEYHGK